MAPAKAASLALLFGALFFGCSAPEPTPQTPRSPAPRASSSPSTAQTAPTPAPRATETPVPPVAPSPVPMVPPYPVGEVVTVPIDGDKSVFVVHAAPGLDRAMIYLHGVCGDPVAFTPWAPVLGSRATLISVLGDVSCPGGSRRKWSRDMGALDRRIGDALAAVAHIRGAPFDRNAISVAGYSQGALRAEALAAKFPKKYSKVVLMAGPVAPSGSNLKQLQSVAILAGALDQRAHLQDAASDLATAGVRVHFWVIPGAHHGEYGPEPSPVMGEMLDWLYQE